MNSKQLKPYLQQQSNIDLVDACIAGDFNDVKKAIKYGADIYANDGRHFMYAEGEGHVEISKFLRLCLKAEKGNKMAKHLIKIMLKDV